MNTYTRELKSALQKSIQTITTTLYIKVNLNQCCEMIMTINMFTIYHLCKRNKCVYSDGWMDLNKKYMHAFHYVYPLYDTPNLNNQIVIQL